MSAKTPLAFLSYAHFDDDHENGKLREFARRLSGEVRMQSGEEFPIFIDRDEIKVGQLWKKRLNDALDGVTFLIPILTPGYFKSEWCRKEIRRFLETEKKLNRTDLILPVYYVQCPPLENATKRAADDLAQALSERQYKDWRPYRHEPWTTPQIGRMFESMALEIVESLERGGIAPQPAPVQANRTETPSEGTTKNLPTPEKAGSPNERPPVIVDELHRGDYATISEAIQKSPPGTKILVRPGTYREGLIIEKVLEIVGDGNRDDIVIEATGSDVILFKASMGRVSNLTLRQTGGGKWYGVDLEQGRLDLEDCDVRCQCLAGIAVHGGAEPRIRRNRIHDGTGTGVLVYKNGAGIIEDNDIFGNTSSGIAIKEGSNPTVRRNRIHECTQAGVLVYENGAGLIEDNDIFGNTLSGIAITGGSSPTVRRNRIHDGKQNGVLAWEKGLGLIEDNEIVSNTYSGVEVREDGDLVVRGNRIRGNREGIRVHKGGKGTFENNVLSDNKTGAWDIAKDGEPNVKRSGNDPES